MTPFGAKLRAIRLERGLTQSQMAAELGLSAAYLSALEHGKRSRPTPNLVRQICGYLGIIWDEADELLALAEQSKPKVTINTAGLSPEATELANLLARKIGSLPQAVLCELIEKIEKNTLKSPYER